ncbi:K(+)-transporting ATPase subunit F [Mumia sp. zg.B53]|nr:MULTISPECIES: K(+)-transporting ATPase subunit F [unclassified Mumia]MBW9207889.1 K(+)-transporting ATPase subunit F [Mumia sp. zg.B17]MBW9209765.1 K(+)-transporting ATPase subunit F [Mumia sp. zg.B21]MBW9214368.1 K(+)-transporting ATPase subunit F [Mumia sp. zg.B53]MDD9347452.1 K(+)-transporting ATPase subunit F [Mumia sp.]QMW66265.1 K(+)-transporting ATPase subunit F [Mumia sp. ZJ1417]
MSLDTGLLITLVALLIGYLVASLIHPERF